MESFGEHKDYYAALGLSPDVDQKEIRRAYHRMIKAIHPDAPGVRKDPSVGRRVAELVEAWRVLGDRTRREAYDRARLARASATADSASRERLAPRAEEPKPTVRPAGWIVEPWEIEGAPRSLIFQCSVSNEGGDSLSGAIEAPRWIHVDPSSVGPLRDGEAPQRVLVQVDSQAWRRDGMRDGVIWLSTRGGDGRKVVVISRGAQGLGPLRQDSWVAYWIVAAVAVLGLGPALILLVGIPAMAWAFFLIATLALPALLDRLRRWEISTVGLAEEAPGWELGPVGDGTRLATVGAMWAFLGWVLGGTANGVIWHESAGYFSPWIGTAAWTWCWLSVSIRDGRRGRFERPVKPLIRWLRPISAAATAFAWALSVGICLQIILGWLVGNAFGVGASVGWILGIVVVFARSDVVFRQWRPWIKQLLWNAVPTITSIHGFSAGLIAAALGARAGFWPMAVSLGVSASSSTLVDLPAASLSTAVAALITAIALLMGFGVGLLTLLPTIKITNIAVGKAEVGRPLVRKGLEIVGEVIESYAFRHRDGHLRDGDSRFLGFVGDWRRLPISMLIVGAAMLLILAYSSAHLLLAIVAFFGIVVG